MRLTQLLAGVSVQKNPADDPEISGICYDSRRVRPGDCFIAVKGTHTDGHDFVQAAVAAGARAALVERRVDATGPLVVVTDTRRALAQVAATFFGHPSRSLVLIGVTGTDGKTTTTTLIHRMLEESGRRAGAMSTVDLRVGSAVDLNQSRQTTPEAPDLQEQLAMMRAAGIQVVVIETSSHGLALDRVTGCEYDLAVYTNIAHEHLDFHRTLDAYREAKARLIDLAAESLDKGVVKTAVLNRDDPSYAYLSRRPIARRLTYGIQLEGDITATRIEPFGEGLRLEATTPLGPLGLELHLIGRWNAYNALAAAACGIALGLSLPEIRSGLEAVTGITGRMERVDAGQPFTVIIDYAHTPQSLEKVLRELRSVSSGRLITVFGSAGERDRDKRPWMGEIAAWLSDYAIFTNEDPREEDAGEILREIASGAEAAGWRQGANYACVEDRAEAIALAVERAQPGDTVLLAGKGHEQSIVVGRSSTPWDERAAAEAAIQRVRSS